MLPTGPRLITNVRPTRTWTTMRTVQRIKRNAGHLLLLLCFGVCTATQAQVPPTIVWQSKATNSYISNPVAVSPDGSVVATLGTNNSVQIWRMSNGVPLIALSGHTSWVGDLAFSPDGAYLASGGGDNSVRVWRTADWSLAGQMIIRWVGGTGRYQLQRALLLGNDWQDEAGVVTTNSVTITRSNSSAFYRVIALPQ